MDIRTEIQATYLETEGDKIQALLDAAARFTELAGYAPRMPILDKLLRSAISAAGHVRRPFFV
jgi:hypothetical protein